MADSHSSPHPPWPRLPSGDDEAELVRRLRAGDEEALGRLMGLYWQDLRRFVSRILDSPDHAEDVVQDAFVRLWTHRREWRSDATVRPVLYRIVRNGALNERRRRRRASKWSRLHALVRRDPVPTPLEDVEGSELSEAVRRAVEALPPRRREIFVLVRYHQFSHREAAEILGLSAGTVANQVSQAARDLREAVASHLGDRALDEEHPGEGAQRPSGLRP